MSRQLESRNQKVDWQVAPAGFEIVNYDEPKFRYRQMVHDMIHSVPIKNLKKKTFVTISTNVMCADIDTSVTKTRPHVEPINRDIYLPLEISLTKWSVAHADKPPDQREVKTLYYMINPGSPPANGSVSWSKDHKNNTHKIDYDKFKQTDNYLESDIQRIVREINAFLTPDRTLFSTSLYHCRQDLGCLKWLNREINYKMKPIKVFSIEDLYVVLIRRLCSGDDGKDIICLGVAKYRFESASNTYDPKHQCQYHRDKAKEDESITSAHCAKALSQCWSHALMDDIVEFSNVFNDIESETAPVVADEAQE